MSLSHVLSDRLVLLRALRAGCHYERHYPNDPDFDHDLYRSRHCALRDQTCIRGAHRKVLKGSDNDLVTDRRKISVNGKKLLLFVGKKGGKPWAIAYETVGKGFGGDITVMVGYDINHDKLAGIQIISHKETPGVGARVTEDQFTKRFKGLDINLNFTLKSAGGDIDGISGASYSSRGVAEAIRNSIALYPEVKKKVLDTLGSKS
jgi:electron transport complex protein RnfG